MKQTFIEKAENKFIFTAFCLLIKNLHEDPNYEVRMPIFLDATCSGNQHLAAVSIQDYELGSRVNLIPLSETDPVGDIYSDMIEPINDEINKYGEENKDYLHFTKIKLDRKTIKQSIMTKVYNVTNYGIERQLENKLENLEIESTDSFGAPKARKDNYVSVVKQDQVYLKNIGLKPKNKIMYFKIPANNQKGYILVTRKDLCRQIASIINERVFFVFPSLKAIYEYLISITKVMIKLKIPLNWFTPSGVKV